MRQVAADYAEIGASREKMPYSTNTAVVRAGMLNTPPEPL